MLHINFKHKNFFTIVRTSPYNFYNYLFIYTDSTLTYKDLFEHF